MGLCLLGSAVSGQNDCAAPYCPSMLALARAGSPLPLFLNPLALRSPQVRSSLMPFPQSVFFFLISSESKGT